MPSSGATVAQIRDRLDDHPLAVRIDICRRELPGPGLARQREVA